MRVLRVEDLDFAEFPGLPDSDYAILSHVWGPHELTYRDLLISSRSDPFVFMGKGAASTKLEGCRSQARQDGIKYFWIDTCCIDKPNHTEFSEAINSMFYWYQRAKVCYAYLYDVSSFEDLAKSKWFTRGWTLQELIAPAHVQFYSKTWKRLGDKSRLAASISHTTGIPPHFLLGEDLERASIAQRMSWASRRSTSKEEDMAYCLLGIFDVHMPLLYGERLTGAFRRLQMEILQLQDDTSIFAWACPPPTQSPDEHLPPTIDTFGLLASSPNAFNLPCEIISAPLPMAQNYVQGIRTPISFNNKGLHLSLPVLRMKHRQLLAVLGCTIAGLEDQRFAIWLQDISTNDGRYVRIKDLGLQPLYPMVQLYAQYRALTIEMRIFRKIAVVPAVQHSVIESLPQSVRATESSVTVEIAESVALLDPYPGVPLEVPRKRSSKRKRSTSNSQREDQPDHGNTQATKLQHTDDKIQNLIDALVDGPSTSLAVTPVPNPATSTPYPASLRTDIGDLDHDLIPRKAVADG